MSFVDQILAATKESESPRRYFYWSALCAISAVVYRNVYLNRFNAGHLFANIYVLLVGKSGIKKGPAINLARTLVDMVDCTRVIHGRTSIQAVINEAGTAITKEAGGLITDARVFLTASEFASFIIEDPAALTILTDLYDTHYHTPEYVNRTIARAKERLKNPYFVLFGASNEIHLREVLPPNAIGGGFLARTAMIYADKSAGINPLTEAPEVELQYTPLVEYLTQISKLKGEFRWSKTGKSIFEEWYLAFKAQDHEDETGTIERLHDHVSKTAMLLALSRLSLTLEEGDITEAIRACMDFIPGTKRVAIGAIGKSISAPGTAVLLRELITVEGHKISRKDALGKHWSHFDSQELDRIAESLQAQGAIWIRPKREGNAIEIYYELNPKVLEKYLKKEDSK